MSAEDKRGLFCFLLLFSDFYHNTRSWKSSEVFYRVCQGSCTHIFIHRQVCSRPPDKSALQKIIFLFSQAKHMLLILKILMRQFFWAPKIHVKTDGKENNHNFTLKMFAYLTLWCSLLVLFGEEKLNVNIKTTRTSR